MNKAKGTIKTIMTMPTTAAVMLPEEQNKRLITHYFPFTTLTFTAA